MNRQLLVLVCMIALTGACGGKSKKAEQPMAQQPAPEPASTAITANDLAGTWQLNMPGGQSGVVVITPTDATHVNVQAGGNLSGNYLVQGPHLLILTHDQKLRPTAWQIINRDALLLTRAPAAADVGADLTGASLTRGSGAAPSAAMPAAPAR
jgi:hypothetical protein